MLTNLMITKLNLLFSLKFLGYDSVYHCLRPFSDKKRVYLVSVLSSKVGNHRFPVKLGS